MSWHTLPLLAVSLLLLPSETARAQAPASVDSLALARMFTQWFYDGQFDSLSAHTEAGFSERATPARYASQADQLSRFAGRELEVLEEKFVLRNGRPQYWRTAVFSDLEEPVLVRWVIDGNGQIIGLGLGPLSQAPPIDPPKKPEKPFHFQLER